MPDHITYDPMYNTVDRDDFAEMVKTDRYAARTGAFDTIISRTHDHFWDPNDAAYIDFDAQPFDLAEQTIMPLDFSAELSSAVRDKLDEGQQIGLANEITHWMVSQLLHGEQGALSLSASLCHIMYDPGAVEYASNQVREEARHVTGFTNYVCRRWGEPLPSGATLTTLLTELVLAPEVYKKLIGMQMLVEGLAMGAFATLHSKTNDPTLRTLVQLVMTDEAFHHKFGKIWADKTVPQLNESEHERVELWAADVFQKILFNLANPEQKKGIYAKFGIDWQWVASAVSEAFTDADRRRLMTESTNIFRVLIKTLLKAGIITDRTRGIYAAWVDMDELHAEDDEVVGTDVAEDGITRLRDINRNRKTIGRALR